jgi:pimeloyl-ACP methyl ester carboxylesterase
MTPLPKRSSHPPLIGVVTMPDGYTVELAVAIISPIKADADPVPVVYLTDSLTISLEDCDIWGVEAADPIDAQRVISDVPTLLFAGMFDPVTPVSSAESALQGLSNGELLVFPSAGHGITFTDTDSGDCAIDLMLDFLDDPFAPLDTACINATGGIDFYVE